MRKILLFLFFFVVSVEAHAVLRLNVETIMSNHIDEGLLLSSEFNFSEFVYLDKEFSKKISEKIEVKIKAVFFDKLVIIGPTDVVKIEGVVRYKDEMIAQEFKMPEMQINLGQKKAVNIEIGEGRWLEVLVSPEMENYDGSR